MALILSRILSPRVWRGAPAYVRAIKAYDKSDFAAALRHFEEWLRWERQPGSQSMTLYALLLNLNQRRRQEVTAVLSRVVAGEFRRRPRLAPETRYAEAYAHYWLAYLTDRSDVLERWLQAYSLRTDDRFAKKYLPLPSKPLLV